MRARRRRTRRLISRAFWKSRQSAAGQSPRQWLVLGELALPARHAAVTEQTNGLAMLTVCGPHAVEILQKRLSIDIARFAGDEAAITLAAHIGGRVWREGEIFILACFRSLAEALHHALMEAAATFNTGRG